MASVHVPTGLMVNQTGAYTKSEFFGLTPTPAPPTYSPTPSPPTPTPIPTPEPVWQKLEVEWDYQVPGEDSPLNYKFSIDFGNMTAVFSSTSDSFPNDGGIFGLSPLQVCPGEECTINFIEQVYDPFAYHDDPSHISTVDQEIFLYNTTQEVTSPAWSHDYLSMPVKYDDTTTTPYRFVNFIESSEDFQSCTHPDTPIIHTSNNVDYYLFGIDRDLTATGTVLRILYFKQATATRKVLDGFQTVDSDKCHPFWVTTNTSTPDVVQPSWPRLKVSNTNPLAPYLFPINQLFNQDFEANPLWGPIFPLPFTASWISNGESIQAGSYKTDSSMAIATELSIVISGYFCTPVIQAPPTTMVRFFDEAGSLCIQFSNGSFPEYVTSSAPGQPSQVIVVEKSGKKMASPAQYYIDVITGLPVPMIRQIPLYPSVDPSFVGTSYIYTHSHYLNKPIASSTIQHKAFSADAHLYFSAISYSAADPLSYQPSAHLALSMGYIMFYSSDVIIAGGDNHISFALCVDILEVRGNEGNASPLFQALDDTNEYYIDIKFQDIPIPWSGEPSIPYPGYSQIAAPSWGDFKAFNQRYGDLLLSGEYISQAAGESGRLVSKATALNVIIWSGTNTQSTIGVDSIWRVNLLPSGDPWTYVTPHAFIAINGFELDLNSPNVGNFVYDYVPIKNGKLQGSPSKLRKLLQADPDPDANIFEPGCWSYDHTAHAAFTMESTDTLQSWHAASQHAYTLDAQTLGYCR